MPINETFDPYEALMEGMDIPVENIMDGTKTRPSILAFGNQESAWKNGSPFEFYLERIEKEDKDEGSFERDVLKGYNECNDKLLAFYEMKAKEEVEHAQEEVFKHVAIITRAFKEWERLSEEYLRAKEDAHYLKSIVRIPTDEILSIFSMDKVMEIRYTENKLYVNTRRLYATEENTGRVYEIGKMQIGIPFDETQELTVCNLDRLTQAYNDNMHAPHIFSGGKMCSGQFSSVFQELRDSQHYAMLVAMLIQFVETVDIDDPAGWFVCEWPEVNPETHEVINLGHSPEPDEYDGYGYRSGGRCEICGYSYEDGYYCEDCGKNVCEDCSVYIEHLEKTVCADCLNEDYFQCERCNEFEHRDDIHEVGNQYWCERCAEDYATSCNRCGKEIDELDAYYDEEDGYPYCRECYDEILEGRSDDEDVE